MLQQYAAIAEMEYNLIRERTQGGLQKKAEAGGWPGGAPPYGYRIEGRASAVPHWSSTSTRPPSSRPLGRWL
ncbi:recombinase family protein [Streptomyces neyagawaensis]|uniref:recombinase family protein n=1 Tax=Streptomyces neyagawaensis TaxID=42238 RepID=UPI0006E27554